MVTKVKGRTSTHYRFWGMAWGITMAILFCSIQPSMAASGNDCLCHNIEKNPHTICIGDSAFDTHLFGHLHIKQDTQGTCCGNDICEVSDGEDCSTCSEDCGECPPSCGDGTCDSGEDCSTCSADCGACCGDGFCDDEIGEDCTFCPEDCGACSTVCGDNTFVEGAGEECDVVDEVTRGCEADVPCNLENDLCVCMRCGNGIVAEGEDCEFDEVTGEAIPGQCPVGSSCVAPPNLNACQCMADSGQVGEDDERVVQGGSEVGGCALNHLSETNIWQIFLLLGISLVIPSLARRLVRQKNSR